MSIGEQEPKKLPEAIRTPITIGTYTDRQPVSTARKVYYKGDGLSPFGPPIEAPDLIRESVLSGRLMDAAERYPHENMEVTTAYFKERLGLEEAFFAWGGGGSDAIIQKIVSYLHRPGHKRQVWGLPPHFPGIVRDIFSIRSVEDEETEYDLMYAPIRASLNATAEEALALARDARIEDRRIKDPDYGELSYVYYLGGGPKGELASFEETEKFVKFAENNGDIVFFDEAQGDIVDDNRRGARFAEKYNNVIAIGSASKVDCLPGVGVGYVVASKEIGAGLKHMFRPYDVPGVNRAIISEVFKPEIIEPHHEKVRKLIREQKEIEVEIFRKAGIHVYPTSEQTAIFMVDGEVEGIHKVLGDLSIDSVDCSAFFITHPELTTRHIRLVISQNPHDARVAARRLATGIAYAKQNLADIQRSNRGKSLRNDAGSQGFEPQ